MACQSSNATKFCIWAHHYNSRAIKDGYTIDDLVKQVESVLAETSVIENNKVLKSTVLRDDGYGNRVQDWAVFEMTAAQEWNYFRLFPRVMTTNHQNQQNKIRPYVAIQADFGITKRNLG